MTYLKINVVLLAVVSGGCGQPPSNSFERQVNAAHNAGEMSRSRSDPGYIPRYETTTIAP